MTGLARWTLMLQLATTLPLVGLIWLIQVVSYPLFARVGAAEFQAYHGAHARLITYVVAPLMVGELVAALVALGWADPALPRAAVWLGAVLAVSVWGLTFFVSVPRHEVLAGGFDARAHHMLVWTNWLRTLAWTTRGGLLLWSVSRVLASGGR